MHNFSCDDQKPVTGDKSSGGVVVRAFASHQYGSGSISRFGVICGLSLLVLFSALRGFPPGTPVFPFPQESALNLNCINFNLQCSQIVCHNAKYA